MAKEVQKLAANNKKAYHDFFIDETYEAGIALHGTEVKSLRMGKCSIKEAFIRIENGEVFEGVVSGITAWGIYVELPNTVEGLVHVAKLPGDYYYYREETYDMVGESTGRTYKLGMTVKVAAVATDKLTRTIDFVIVEEEEE